MGEIQIKRLQDNLLAIRKIAGWTAEELGGKIGVTKQTISNLENNKVKMSQTQYIAIRTILDYEIQNNKDNKVLPEIINILLDSNKNLDEEVDAKVREKIGTIAATAGAGIRGDELLKIAAMMLGPFGYIGGVLVGKKLKWLNPFMR